MKTGQLMFYWEIIALCSEVHKKHRNALRGRTVELFGVKLCGTQSNHWGWKGQGVKDEIYRADGLGWGGVIDTYSIREWEDRSQVLEVL